MNIYLKLRNVQVKIKAPKNLYNSFGKYNYRSAEGICEAVKPYLEKEGLALTLSDDVREIGGRFYLEATATLIDLEDGQTVQAKALARESDDKKGMDASQVTGTASSYARKYALNGLFLLDDTKDADTDEYHNQNEAKQTKTTKKEAAKPESRPLPEIKKEFGGLCCDYAMLCETTPDFNAVAAEIEKRARQINPGCDDVTLYESCIKIAKIWIEKKKEQNKTAEAAKPGKSSDKTSTNTNTKQETKSVEKGQEEEKNE